MQARAMCIQRLCDGRCDQDHHLTKIINALIIWRALLELINRFHQ
jgi:hypothetical protein